MLIFICNVVLLNKLTILLQVSPPKVTRSGRKVKLPKMSLPQGIPQKPKKKKKNNAQNKNYVSCFQCAMVS